MAEQKNGSTDKSIQQRVNAILSTYHDREKVFAAQATAEEVEELEYLLARAESELRAMQRKVDQLRSQLEDKRAKVAQ